MNHVYWAMEVNTHEKADPRLLGTPVLLEKGTAVVELTATEEMAVDDRGLIHGGFTFGLADYAAMLAVNDPLVVLGSADVKFTAPVKVGESMVATGVVEAVDRGGATSRWRSPSEKRWCSRAPWRATCFRDMCWTSRQYVLSRIFIAKLFIR